MGFEPHKQIFVPGKLGMIINLVSTDKRFATNGKVPPSSGRMLEGAGGEILN